MCENECSSTDKPETVCNNNDTEVSVEELEKYTIVDIAQIECSTFISI